MKRRVFTATQPSNRPALVVSVYLLAAGSISSLLTHLVRDKQSKRPGTGRPVTAGPHPGERGGGWETSGAVLQRQVGC